MRTDVESLKVESFRTAGAQDAARGTVRARELTFDTCSEQNTIEESCLYGNSCGDSCFNACYTRRRICPYTE